MIDSDLFFTSDEHYGHRKMLELAKRPFANEQDHIQESIRLHNETVPKGARVYHLGDMFWRTMCLKDALDIIYSLNGQHYFIWGNHDELIENNKALRDSFVWCKDIAQVYHQKVDPAIVVCHYAMRVWRNSHHGAYQLYGHTHGQLPDQDNLSLDVGQDVWGFRPVSIEEIIEKMEKKKALGHEDPTMPRIRKERGEK